MLRLGRYNLRRIGMEADVATGRTAPSLIEDILRYDLRYLADPNTNPLTNLRPEFDPQTNRLIPADRPRPESCRHELYLKRNQSQLPRQDELPELRTTWRVSATCKQCLMHFAISANFYESRLNGICPSQQYPLHHFQRASGTESPLPPTERGPSNIWDYQVFRCSAPGCHASYSIGTVLPFFNPQRQEDLLSNINLSERHQYSIRKYPEKLEGKGVQKASSVLLNLRKYYMDSLQLVRKGSTTTNPAVLLGFGDPKGRAILKELGFEEIQVEDGSTRIFPPRVEEGPEKQDRFLQATNSAMQMDDIVMECTILINRRPPIEWMSDVAHLRIEPALPEIRRIFHCQSYEKRLSRRTANLNDPVHPYYGILGACEDFSDRLLYFAFERQSTVDPSNRDYYLEKLKDIAIGRESIELNTQVAIVESQLIPKPGHLAAYRYFNVQEDAEEGQISAVFTARLEDSPRQEQESRTMLKKIAKARNSENLMDLAEDQIKNHIQAYQWLSPGMNDDTPDDMIMTMVQVKLGEDPLLRKPAMEAVQLIAVHRNSESLRMFAITGEPVPVQMDVGEAYGRLGIRDRTVGDDMIITAYVVASEEAPMEQAVLQEALQVICDAKKSDAIAEYLRTGHYNTSSFVVPKAPSHGSADWPIGLENIGNTCYLNSLLQSMYTIAPLRELVMNIDDHKLIPTEENLAKKAPSVGRKVSKIEVINAQKWADEMKGLFETMYSSEHAAIEPSMELARQTLQTSGEPTMRSPASVRDRRQSLLGEIGGKPVMGPFPQPPIREEEEDLMAVDEEGDNSSVTADAGSESGHSSLTLIDDEGDSDLPMIDIDTTPASTPVKMKTESAPSTPSQAEPVNEPLTQDHVDAVSESVPITMYLSQDEGKSPVPSGITDLAEPDSKTYTPPIPPRAAPRPPPLDITAVQGERKAHFSLDPSAQQDVTEAISKVLLQLDLAITPMEKSKDSEEEDLLTTLFYGRSKVQFLKAGDGTPQDQIWSDLKVNVERTGSTSLYAALDESTGRALVDDGRVHHETITRLPSILLVQVKRVQWDIEKKESYKNIGHLSIPEVLYMDRYMDPGAIDGGHEIAEKRRLSWKWSDNLKALKDRRESLTILSDGTSPLGDLRLTTDWLANDAGGMRAMKITAQDDQDIDVAIESQTSLPRPTENPQELASILDRTITGAWAEVSRE